MKYRKKQVVVEARELEEPEVVQTIDGGVEGIAGDFVVTRSDGNLSLIKRGVFLMLHEEFDEIPCQVGRVDIGFTGRTLAWAGAFSALLDKIVGHPRTSLRMRARELKQTDGEGWVAGELLESMCIYADAVDAQIGRVRFEKPLAYPEEEAVVEDEIVQKAAALDCLMVLIEGQDQPSLRAKAQAAAEKIDGADAVSAIVSGLCMISWTMENGGTGSLDGGMTWFRFEEPDKPAIPCDCEACEQQKVKRVGPCAPQGDSGSGSI